jgi:ATP-dependent Clp protease ATP-binding subunit ClpA
MALVYAVDFSTKYVADRKLPDKAIDLLDEACAAVKM